MVAAVYIFVADEFLRTDNGKLLGLFICEICGLPLVFGLWGKHTAPANFEGRLDYVSKI